MPRAKVYLGSEPRSCSLSATFEFSIFVKLASTSMYNIIEMQGAITFL